MARTRHHRDQKNLHMGEDWGAKYKCDKGYCGGTGKHPKDLAHTEMRMDKKRLLREEIDNYKKKNGID